MGNPFSLVSRLVSAAFGLLLAAIACVIAVNLIQQIWPWLVAILGVIVVSGAAVSLLRMRSRGW